MRFPLSRLLITGVTGTHANRSMRRSPGLAGGEQCPATVPGCAAAEFCAPSLPADYAPAGSYRNSSAACLPGCHDAGKLDGQLVCMQVHFAGYSCTLQGDMQL